MNRRSFWQGAILATIAFPLPTLAAAPLRASMFKSPQCGCCEDYATYLRDDGFEVTVTPANDLAAISRNAGVPDALQSCHTMFIDEYVVVGHVPANVIRRMLSERPAIAGITLPGMPEGSPGMPGRKNGPFTIYAVAKNAPPALYAIE
jgi:hypothetical protein